ncbi:MAG: hypothetical protein HYZ18_12770 [Pseudogulbenkiania sp.]|nr:hypothetical protein [Pseudogulbenkiania sp.]
MAKFLMTETIHSEKVKTSRLGTSGAGNTYDDKEVGKAVKLSGDSAHVLCVAGDPIQGFIDSVNLGVYDGFSLGGVISTGYKSVVFDGLEATPGTGTIAVGDYVVAGTMVAKGTALSGAQKVCKATNQPGVAIVSTVATADTAAAVKVQLDAVLALVADQTANSVYAWRVVSLGSAASGAVGTTGIIERVSI